MSEGDGPTVRERLASLMSWLLLAYLAGLLIRQAGPLGPRFWHASMVGSQNLAAAFGQAAMASELAYRAAVDKTTLA